MDEQDDIKVLNAKIQDLEFSDGFKHKSSVMGFNTLLQITEISPEKLMATKGFDYNWFGEVVTYLINKKLLHKLQPTPGNNPG
nr:hypothetical protein [Mucilaginibacter sp. L294]